MKANLDDCMLIKKYHRELTDAAIRLIRKAHKIVLDFKDNFSKSKMLIDLVHISSNLKHSC